MSVSALKQTTKSISTTRTKKKSFDPHMKIKPSSTRTQNPSPRRSQTMSISTYTLKPSNVRGADENNVDSDSPQNKVKPVLIKKIQTSQIRHPVE